MPQRATARPDDSDAPQPDALRGGAAQPATLNGALQELVEEVKPIDASARAEDSTQDHVDTSTGTVALSTVRKMDGSILEVDLSGANNIGEARRRVGAATKDHPDRIRLLDGCTVLDDQHAIASGALSLAMYLLPPCMCLDCMAGESPRQVSRNLLDDHVMDVHRRWLAQHTPPPPDPSGSA